MSRETVNDVYIAMVCHEVNRAYCEAIGDNSQKPWHAAEMWQKDSAVNGVEFVRSKKGECLPGDAHRSWLEEKEKTGWKYGPVKDVEKKEHPCFVPFEKLPNEQKVKDHLFVAVVHALAGH